MRAAEALREALQLGSGQRLDRAEQARRIAGARILFEMDGIDKERRHVLGDDHRAVRADQRRVAVPKRGGKRSAALRRVDVRGVGVHRDAVGPARRVVLHQLEPGAGGEREHGGGIGVMMQDRAHVGACAQYLRVDEHLGRRLGAARPIDDMAVEIADQQPVGAHRGAAVVDGLDQEQVAAGQPRADVARIAEQPFGVEQQGGRRHLVSQRRFGLVGHRRAWLSGNISRRLARA
jgi:hypothetical protein